MCAVVGLGVVAQVGLENPGRAHRQKILIHQGFETDHAGGYQAAQIVRNRGCGLGLDDEIAEKRQLLFAHLPQVIGKLTELPTQQRHVFAGVAFSGEARQRCA